MYKKYISIKNYLLILAIILLTTSGCTIKFGSSDRDIGGVFKTTDRGDNWANLSLIPTTTGAPQSIVRINSNALTLDPGDNQALYLGSVENGLFYTYDGANNWKIAYGLKQIPINSVAIDPNSKCIVYVTSANKVYKTVDCSRNWTQIYNDDDSKAQITHVAVDNYNSKGVYIGTSRGEIIKSLDAGASWQTINRFKNEILKISINPFDTRLIFVATAKNIYRSENSGNTWIDLNESLEDFQYSAGFKDLVISRAKKGLIFLATGYGLLRSDDYGYSWKKIELITPEKGAIVNSIGLSAVNTEVIYYVTNTTFYRSIDGGSNWSTIKLLTTRAGWNLIVDPRNDNIVYMGVKNIEEKKSEGVGRFGI